MGKIINLTKQRQLASTIAGDPVQKQFLRELERLRGGLSDTHPRLNVKGLLAGYSRFPFLRAVVAKTSEAAAAVEWSVVVNGEKITNHPAVNPINHGNSVFSGYALRKMLFAYLSISGEAFFLKERDRLGTPIAVWPLPPHWVSKLPIENSGYFQINYNGHLADIPESEVIYFRDPDLTNPYGRGAGSGTVLADELETDEFASKHLKSFFRNSARPDLLIYSEDPENPIGPEDAKRLEVSWMNKLRGVFNAYRPFFLPGKIGVKQIQSSLKDMQIVDIRRFQRDVIMQVYGIPPEALGILDNSNRATIEAAEFFLSKHVVLPKLEFVKSYLEQGFLKEFLPDARYGYSSPVEEDKVHQLRVMRTAPWAFRVNEIRKAGEVQELQGEEGQYHFMPSNGGTFFKNFSDMVEGNTPETQEEEETDAPAEEQASG